MFRRLVVHVSLALVVVGLGGAAALAAPGDQDSSFDGDGIRTIDYGSVDIGNDVLVQPDGKIVTAGHGNLNLDFMVSRLNPDGSPDASFGAGGNGGVNFGGFESGHAAALQADGKVVVVGRPRLAATATSRSRASTPMARSTRPSSTTGRKASTSRAMTPRGTCWCSPTAGSSWSAPEERSPTSSSPASTPTARTT